MSRLKLEKDGKKCQLNLYTFARHVLGYKLLRKDPHLAWCRELDRRHSRSIILEPRHTYKSTIFTKAYPIWRLFQDPNLRILIVNATADNAEAFLSEIVAHYLRNTRLHQLYDGIYHKPPLDERAAKKKRITLSTRTSFFSEPSISTMGALGNLVSAHYDLIIVDDLCNIDDRESHAIREKKKRWFQDLVSVLSPDGELVVVGTRWHFDDAYSFILKEIDPALPPKSRYFKRIDSCYLADGISPRFPSILSAEKLRDLRVEKGPLIFACNYLNEPLPAEHQIFPLKSMHTFAKTEVDLSSAKVYGFCDPSRGGADFTSIVTVAVLGGKWYVFHCDMSHTAQSKLADKIIRLHMLFNYQVFGIEANDLGKVKGSKEPSNFELVLQHRQEEEGLTVPLKLVWNTSPKDARIQSIEPSYVIG